VVLLAGAACFIIGVLYTAGPVPISRQPQGEILSGIFYGLFIPFILLYINMPHGELMSLSIGAQAVDLSLSVKPIISLLFLSIPPVFTTANIMLANNICDVEKDVLSKRYTLPYYIGKKALWLFAALYYLIYPACIVMVILGILPLISLLSLLTVFYVHKNISIFFKKQDKATTFIVSIKNYIAIMSSNVIMLFIGALIGI